jgi:hypothetical protein
MALSTDTAPKGDDKAAEVTSAMPTGARYITHHGNVSHGGIAVYGSQTLSGNAQIGMISQILF